MNNESEINEKIIVFGNFISIPFLIDLTNKLIREFIVFSIFFNFSFPFYWFINVINNRINDKWLNSNLIYRIRIEIGITYGQFRIIIYSYLK